MAKPHLFGLTRYKVGMSVVDDHNNVILSLMARSMGDGAASTLTLVIGPATCNRAGVLTAEGHQAFYFFTAILSIKQP